MHVSIGQTTGIIYHSFISKIISFVNKVTVITMVTTIKNKGNKQCWRYSRNFTLMYFIQYDSYEFN